MRNDSLENKLKNLYELQQVDLRLQEIHEMKGDLPGIVEELRTKVGELKAKIKELNDFIKTSRMERDTADKDIIEFAEKIEKYKSQQLQVKSNKQYDALTREIEGAESRSTQREKEMAILEGKILVARKDIEDFTAQHDQAAAELAERQKELTVIGKEHEREELKLQHERDKLLVRVEKMDLERYERIRKAKGGSAIVPIKRGSCGGCFNRVPPQKLLELRQNSRFFTCEHCGRILVSDHIVEISDSP